MLGDIILLSAFPLFLPVNYTMMIMSCVYSFSLCTIVTPFFKGTFYGTHLINGILCHGTFEINHGRPWFISNVPWQRMPLINFLPTKFNYNMLVIIAEPTALTCGI